MGAVAVNSVRKNIMTKEFFIRLAHKSRKWIRDNNVIPRKVYPCCGGTWRTESNWYGTQTNINNKPRIGI